MDSESNNIFLRSHEGNDESGRQWERGDLVPQENVNIGMFRQPFSGRVGDGRQMEEPSRQQNSRQQTPDRRGEQSVWTRRVVLFVLVSCILFVIVDSLGDRNIEAVLLKFLQWVQVHPFQGAVAVTVVYIVATVLFVPGSILSLGAGFAIGRAFENTAVGVLLATTVRNLGLALSSY
jgi:hypothetical protein